MPDDYRPPGQYNSSSDGGVRIEITENSVTVSATTKKFRYSLILRRRVITRGFYSETQWRKSRGGRGGHVPLENWTAGDSNALCPPPKFGF